MDQDTEESWKLQVKGHDGKVIDLPMEKGQLALYESATVRHGRPLALNGLFILLAIAFAASEIPKLYHLESKELFCF